MNILKIFRKEPEEEKELEEVTVNFEELKQKIKSSVIKINEINEEYPEPLIDKLFKVKASLNELKNKELLITDSLTIIARKQKEELITSLTKTFKKPKSLITLNEFIKETIDYAEKALEAIKNNKELSITLPEELNTLKENINELLETAEEAREGVMERNKQLNSFKELINETRKLNNELKKLEAIKEEEMELRKKISNYERDKAFMSREMARIKAIESYTELSRAENSLKNINAQKIELESNASKIINKFSKIMRKEFNNDEFTTRILSKTLEYIHNNEGLFNKKMSELIKRIKNNKELSDKERKDYIKAVSNDAINDLISEYKKIKEIEEEIKKKDFTLLKKYKAFERRLIELNQLTNNELKKLSTYDDKKKKQEEQIKAIKAKVESLASECYEEKVKIKIRANEP